jgi:hypothetical protein
MMELAKRNTIVYRGNSFRVRIWYDMSRIKKLFMAKPAASALPLVRIKDFLAETLLMKSLPG